MINKLKHLSDVKMKQFYRSLCKEITAIIGDFFDSEEELQETFKDFKNSDIREYHDVMDMILADIAPELVLTWRDIKKLNHKRFHLCSVCGEPFIAYDNYNKVRICYGQDYKRYIIGSDNQEGHFVKYTEMGQSTCYAKRRRQITRTYRQKKVS